MSDQTAKDTANKGAIIAAARELYQQQGMEHVTMDDVAKACGKAKSSLYYYYKSKEEILEAVMDVEINEILTTINIAMTDETTMEGKIRAFCATKIAVLRSKKALQQAWLSDTVATEMTATRIALATTRKKYLKRERALFDEMLVEGISNGQLRAMDEKNRKFLAYVIISGLYGLVKEMSADKDYKWLDDAIAAMSNVMINGLKKM